MTENRFGTTANRRVLVQITEGGIPGVDSDLHTESRLHRSSMLAAVVLNMNDPLDGSHAAGKPHANRLKACLSGRIHRQGSTISLRQTRVITQSLSNLDEHGGISRPGRMCDDGHGSPPAERGRADSAGLRHTLSHQGVKSTDFGSGGAHECESQRRQSPSLTKPAAGQGVHLDFCREGFRLGKPVLPSQEQECPGILLR